MPSFNEITGARISSGVHVKGTDKDKFAQGWDLLWGKKETICDVCTRIGCTECRREVPVGEGYTKSIHNNEEVQYKLICPNCQADRLLEYCKNKNGCTFVAKAQYLTREDEDWFFSPNDE